VSTATALREQLARSRAGDAGATALLSSDVYAALKALARARLGRSAGATLTPTVLVNEALLRLLEGASDPESRNHLMALAALQIRNVLVDHARAKASEKRGGAELRVTLDSQLIDAAAGPDADVLDLDAALGELGAADPRAAEVLTLTYFGGMTASEVALALAHSVATVERDLAFGHTWLKHRLSR
jgi:RNA polymerase sigma factor (TIGR02999 family)